MRRETVLCAGCGSEFTMGLVELSRHRGVLRCPGCEGDAQEAPERARRAEALRVQDRALQAMVERLRGRYR